MAPKPARVLLTDRPLIIAGVVCMVLMAVGCIVAIVVAWRAQ